MELSARQKRKKLLLELKDMLTGAAFPFMIQLVFSASLIMFADYSGDVALQIVALLLGEALLIGAYILFGRQNGITAYRRMVQAEKKRSLNSDDITVYYRTGEYALWKGFAIGALSAVPCALVQFIYCLAPNTVCEFILKYGFGWETYPFIVIGQATGKISEWLNYVWIIVLIGIHAAAYYWGGSVEKKRQEKVAQAQEFKGKRRK